MEETMKRRLAISLVSGSCLLAFALIEAKAAEMARPHVQAEGRQTVEWGEPGRVGTRLDGTSTGTRWWDDRKTEVLSKLLDRPRRWSKLVEDWSDHILRRVRPLGAPGIAMAYMMLMLGFSLVHAFPQKTAPQKIARKARPKRSR
jgi:hypothetical protein